MNEGIKGRILNRDRFVKNLNKLFNWDILVIGGGATGLGTALDAASRGYTTLLLEQADFAKGTSSRSTKLIHGGVRYLAQGDIGLVYEALHERGLLLQNAPHIVKRQSFIIPCYDWLSKAKYLAGLKIYDWLSGRLSFGKSTYLTREKVMEFLPGINGKTLKGGIEYFDGQFDDARLAINIAQTCAEKGGVLLNYMKVTSLLKSDSGKINGVIACDLENNKEYHIHAKVVINATGVFVDDILQIDAPTRKPLVRPSQGAHVVLEKSFMNGNKALMIPQTADGRVLFAVPWHDHILLGTTDTPVDKHSLEPMALEEEIDFILQTAGLYLSRVPLRKDVLSVFAGLRPLAAPEKNTSATKEISRSHKLLVTDTGLITITGGKWTTYRQMAEDTVNQAVKVGNLHPKPCTTASLKIHGYSASTGNDHFSIYGSDEQFIQLLIKERPELRKKLHRNFPHVQAEVVWSVQNEMARTIEDVLARRLRVLFLDARAAIDMAPQVAALIAEEFNYNEEWQKVQVRDFTLLANQYLLEPYSSEASVISQEN